MRPSTWFRAASTAMGALAVLALATPASAQQTGTVTGVVTESGTGRPLQGVQVFMVGRTVGPVADRSSRGVVTDADGRYTMAGVPAGQITLRARFVGFTSQTATLSLVAGQSATLDFTLRPSVISLDEIVVTGAGVAQSKKQLGNTIATVDVQEVVKNAPVTSFSETLAAREPGVEIKPNGGIAGSSATIRIRGTSSVSMGNQPVVYVDGVRIDGGQNMFIASSGGGDRGRMFDDINPEAIERIEVLKGAAAATLYGSEANGGVIQIFTKKGSAGKPRFNFRIDQGFSQIDKGRIKPNTGFARNTTQLTNMNAIYGTNAQLYEPVQTNILSDLYGTGYNYTYSADVTGGSDDFQYFVAGRWLRDDGPIQSDLGPGARDDVRRLQGSAHFTLFPRDRLSFRLSAQFTDVHQDSPPNNNNIFGFISSATFGKPERANCDNSSFGPGDGTCTGPGNPTGQRAFATTRETAQRFIEGNVEHLNTSATITYQAHQTVNVDVTFGIDVTNQNNFDFRPFGHEVDMFTTTDPGGQRWAGSRNNREITVDTRATWTERFGNISSQLVLGGQGFISRNKNLWGVGTTFPGPGLEVVGAAANTSVSEAFSETVNIGLLFQEQLGLNDWIFVTGGGRWDRNSAFGDSTSGQFYPKISASIIPSDLGSWNNTTISSLRFRGAFGKSGQQPGAFDRFTTFSSLAAATGPGLQPDNLGNPNLKPEVSKEFELGGEVGLLNNRAALDVTYWNRETTDALVQRQFVVSGGFLNPQLDNIGLLKAYGWEVKFNALVMDRENLSIDVFANGAFTHEEIRSMGGAPAIKIGGSYPRYRNFIRGPDSLAVDCSFAPEGATCRNGNGGNGVIYYSPGTHLGARLIPQCGAGRVYLGGANAGSARMCWTPGSTVPFDSDGDGAPDTEAAFKAFLAANSGSLNFDMSIFSSRLLMDDEDGDGDVLDNFLGKPTPDWAGAFGANFTIMQNLQLNTLFEYKTGNFFVNNLTDAFRNSNGFIGRNTPRAAELESTFENPATSVDDAFNAALAYVQELKALAPNSGLNTIKNGKFIRFRELGLTYTAPASFASKLGLSNLAFNVAGRNLHLWTGYDGVDPELNATNGDTFLQSVEAFGTGIPRRWTFSVRFGF